MNSIRKWLYKPKKTDTSLLAQFYFADEELNRVATELDSFDSRKDPERCQALVTQLRACQDKVLTIVQRMMVEAIPYARTSRDFRVKFPDDVVQENLAGQLWFGAECLAAGSSIMNREAESASMRPLARALTKNLESLRHILRDQCLVNLNEYTGRIREALTIFDKLFAEFELSYVSAMVPVKTVKEYETIQEITVLFSETTIRAKSLGYITTDMIDEYSPALMFTIPRLAIVCGLLVFADGPLNPDSPSWNISDMFRPFQSLLYKIRELLFTLSDAELLTLERALCSQEEPNFLTASASQGNTNSSSDRSTTTTATTGVQTDSPVLKKVRANDDTSCSSLDRLGSDCSDNMSLPEDAVGTNNNGEVMMCQSDKVVDGAQSSAGAVFYETEGGVSGKMTPHGGDNSSLRMQRNLNKSDSNDSGLHSDVVSTSDSQFTISSSDSNQLLSVSGVPSPLLSPSMDDVMELCMEQEDKPVSSTTPSSCPESGGGEQNGPGSVGGGESMCADCGKAAGGQEISNSDKFLCDGTAGNGELLCDGTVGAVNSGSATEEEEESFHTPSSGLSPLHQPCSNIAVLQAQALGNDVSQVTGAVQCLAVADSRASASSAFSSESASLPEFTDITDHNTHVAGFSSCGIEDDIEEDSTFHGGNGRTDSVDSGCVKSHQPVHLSRGVLQKVQTVYICPDPSEANEVHSRSSSEAGSNLRDSSPTDPTITDQTPPSNTTLTNTPTDTTSTLTGLTPVYTTLNDTILSIHTPEVDNDLASVHHASLSHCDTDSSSCTLQATCDNESQDQKTFSQSQLSCDSNSGVVNSNADFTSALNNEDASTTPVVGEINLGASQHQCDRCTQTPHSAINNDQSSKIHHHHHHHHHRQHSNPSIASSTSSLSSHSTPQGSAKHSKQDKSRDRGKRKDVPNISKKKDVSDASHSEAASSQTVQSQAGKKRSVEKSQKSGSKKDPSSKARKTSHRTDSQKFRSVKSKRSAPENEARLKQYADNWSDCSTNSEGDAKESAKKKAKVPGDDVERNSPSSSSEESSSTSDPESDQDSCGSSETSSYNSESHDDEEIALAVQAAELANRNQARARFRSSSDMIHRLFVCISGVADQLQTNFAGDLRNILRVVFNLNCSEPVVMEDEKSFCRYRRRGARFFLDQFGNDPSVNISLRDAPAWIPDDQSTLCMSCKTPFTFVRRRHHCRNCGKIFCGRCSSNAVSLPHFGHSKPVRVCNHCFVFQVNPFAVQAQV